MYGTSWGKKIVNKFIPSHTLQLGRWHLYLLMKWETMGVTDAKMHKCSWDLINSDIIIYFCKIVLPIVLLEIQLHFVNYDHVFRSFNCILEVKIVLSMQRKL